VEKDLYMPRLPSYKKKLTNADKKIPIITLNDLPDKDPAHYGLNGSPTQVEQIFPPESSTGKITVNGTAAEIADFLYKKLTELKFIQGLGRGL
jgi:electron transfer flavoprotein beta subunit